MDIKREPGYYWVKHNGQWKIVEYLELLDKFYGWSFCGDDDYFGDELFEQIYERRIEPPEIVSQQEYDRMFGPNSSF